MRLWLTALFISLAGPALADVTRIVQDQILPGFQTLATRSAVLAQAAEADCTPTAAPLRAAYHDSFDAWIAVSHLRFGASEEDDRAFALAFWPDPRGATPKALAKLMHNNDPALDDPEVFATVSVAARGFYALEYLLFDPQLTGSADPAILCRMIRATTRDIARVSDALWVGWQGYGGLMTSAGRNTIYRTPREAARQVFTALSTGLEFTGDTRLGRPLGSYDRPRPKRAEARRSGRSLRHVQLSLTALRPLAAELSGGDAALDALFARAMDSAARLDDPVFAGVAEPQKRFHIEALQQQITDIRTHLSTVTGPQLGVAAGFNALDGD